MAVIDDVKLRLGITYTDKQKDREIKLMLEGAKAFFIGAGWRVDDNDPLAVEAYSLYCKMAQSTDPHQLQNHPVLLAFIAQGRRQNDFAV